MAVTSGFFNSVDHDRVYDAEEISSMFDGIILDGVYQGYGNVFNIKPGSLPNTIVVESGRAWFDHTWTLNDNDYAIQLPESNIMLPRFDAIVIEVNLQDRKNRIIYYEGTPASVPEKECPANTQKVHYYPIAYIRRPAESTQVTAGDIISNIGGDRCPIVTGVLEVMSSERFLTQMNEEFETFMTENRDDFEEWFAGVRDLVGSDPVLELNNKITELDRKVDRTKYKFDDSFKVGTDNTVSLSSYDPMTTNDYISKKIMSSFMTNVPNTVASGGNTFPITHNGSAITNAAGNSVLQYAFTETPKTMSYNMTGYRKILNPNYVTTALTLFNINYGTSAIQHYNYDRVWSPEFINSQLNQQYFAVSCIYSFTMNYLDVALVSNEVATVYTSNKTMTRPTSYGSTLDSHFDCYENNDNIVLVSTYEHIPKSTNTSWTELPDNPTLYINYWIFNKMSRTFVQKTIEITTDLNKKFVYYFYIDDAHSDASSIKLCFYFLNSSATINTASPNYGRASTAIFKKYNLNYINNTVTQEQSTSLGTPYTYTTFWPPIQFMRRKIASNEYYDIALVSGNTLSIISLNRGNKGNAIPHAITKTVPIINIDIPHDLTSGYYSLVKDGDEIGFYCLEDSTVLYVSIKDTYAYVSKYKYKTFDPLFTNLIFGFPDINTKLDSLVTESGSRISFNTIDTAFIDPYNIQCPFTDNLKLAINSERTWGISV